MTPALEVTDADRDAADALRATSPISDYIRDEAMLEAFAAHRTRAHTEGHAAGYEAAVRDVVAWLRGAFGEKSDWNVGHASDFADAIERGEFKP